MISDKYQGVIVYLVLKDLISKEELFGGESSPRFDDFETICLPWKDGTFYPIIASLRSKTSLTCMLKFEILIKYFDLTNSIDTSSITVYRDMKKCKELFKNRFGIEASIKDCEVIRRVCEAVSTRAARLTAAGIVALVKKINKMDGCTVAVDGSTYKRDPFPDRYVLQLCNVTSISFMVVTIMHPYGLIKLLLFVDRNIMCALEVCTKAGYTACAWLYTHNNIVVTNTVVSLIGHAEVSISHRDLQVFV